MQLWLLLIFDIKNIKTIYKTAKELSGLPNIWMRFAFTKSRSFILGLSKVCAFTSGWLTISQANTVATEINVFCLLLLLLVSVLQNQYVTFQWVSGLNFANGLNLTWSMSVVEKGVNTLKSITVLRINIK